MKLYRKKLDSLEALKREKIRLRYKEMRTKESDLNPLTEIGRSKLSGSAKAGILGTLMELVSSKSQLQTALAIGKPVLKVLRKRRAKKQAIRYTSGLPKKKSVVKKVVTEIAVHYIIGKAVQMSVNGIRLYMRRRKAKKSLRGSR